MIIINYKKVLVYVEVAKNVPSEWCDKYH